MKMELPPLPYTGALVIMLKTILREGGYVEAGYRRVVPRVGSGTTEPVGNFRDVCKRMIERGELVQYKPARDIGISYVWGMRGITPDVCKDRDELFSQLELMSHRVERLKFPKWISIVRHRPTDTQRIVAFVPMLANAGHVGQVMGRFDVKADLVTVAYIVPAIRRAERVIVQYEFTHWMPQLSDPTE